MEKTKSPTKLPESAPTVATVAEPAIVPKKKSGKSFKRTKAKKKGKPVDAKMLELGEENDDEEKVDLSHRIEIVEEVIKKPISPQQEVIE